MDPVSAFSIACGVIQVVDFSSRLLSKCKELYKKGSLAEHEDSKDLTKSLGNLQLAMATPIQNGHSTKEPQIEQQELMNLAKKCSETAQELLKRLEKLKASKQREIPWKALKAMRDREALNRLQTKLEGYRRTLDTRLLVGLRQLVRAVSLAQSDGFDKLDNTLRGIAVHLAKGPISFDQLAEALRDQATATAEHISQQFQKLEIRREEREHCEKYLASLHFPEIQSRQEEVAEAHQKTFQWVFDKSGEALRPWTNFVHWLESSDGIYWISGKPGSGKSTLMNYVWQDKRTMEALHGWATPNEILCPVFFFWAAGSPMQKTVVGLLRSLLYQVFERFPNLVLSLASQAATSKAATPIACEFPPIAAWTERRLRDTLRKIALELSISCRLCLFIDGLDEFSGDHYALIELIQEVVSKPGIKCCLSSRQEPPFVKAFGTSSMLRLQDLTRNDIKDFVSTKLGELPQMQAILNHNSDEWTHRVDLIFRKAEGVFLWVELAVKSQILGVRNDDDPETLWQRLESLPTEVEGLYTRMLDRIPKEYRKEAGRYIRLAKTLHIYRIPSILDIALATHGLKDDMYLLNLKSNLSEIGLQCAKVNERIEITCSGILTSDNEAKTLADAIDMRSWEPKTPQKIKSLELWGSLHVKFCHRSAMDFFSKVKEGQTFLNVHSPVTLPPCITFAAVLFAHVAIWNSQGRSEEEAHSLSMIFKHLAEAQCDNDASAVIFLDYLDRTIPLLDCQYSNPPNGDYWSQMWDNFRTTFPRRFYSPSDSPTGGLELPISASRLIRDARMTGFLAFAASSGAYSYVEHVLNKCSESLDPLKAEHLAVCATWRFYNYIPGFLYREWEVNQLSQLRLLVRLVSAGVNPNIAAYNTTIWEECLGYMYDERPNDWRIDRSHVIDHGGKWEEPRVDWDDIIITFLLNGADAFPRIQYRIQSLRSSLVWIEVDTFELSTYRRCLERIKCIPERQGFLVAREARPKDTPPRIFFWIWCLSKNKEHKGYELSIEQRRQLYKILDSAIDAPSESRKRAQGDLAGRVLDIYQEYWAALGPMERRKFQNPEHITLNEKGYGCYNCFGDESDDQDESGFNSSTGDDTDDSQEDGW